MDINEVKKKTPIRYPGLTICIEFFIAVAVALFLLTLISQDFMSPLAVASSMMLSLLCIPLSAIIYRSIRDTVLKTVFMGLMVYFSIQSIAGAVIYILPMMIDHPLIPLHGMLIMISGYLPLIISMYMVMSHKNLNIGPMIKHIVLLANIICSVTIVYFVSVYSPDIHGLLQGSIIYTASVIADMIIISFCIAILTGEIPRCTKAIFGILITVFLLSLIADSLVLVSTMGIYDGSNYAQFFYSIMLIFITVSLLVYSLYIMNNTVISQVNKELYDTRKFVGDLITQSPDAICISDTSGNAVFMNERFENLIRMLNHEHCGNFNIFNDQSSLGQNIDTKASGVNGNKLTTASARIRLDDGNVVCLAIKIFPTFSSDGSLSSHIMIVEDVTEREQAIEEVYKSRQELEDRVIKRTSELARTNESLEKEIAERKEAEEKIRQSLKEKEILLKEVHHRVKNNLQIISSLFSLQSDSTKYRDPEEVFRQGQNRIKSMALIHEKLYQSSDLAKIDFSSYVSMLAGHLYRSYAVDPGKVRMKINVEKVNLDIDTAIPCGLILNELISNSFKHAFKAHDEGEISILMRQFEDGTCLLEIRDNGVGLPQEIELEKIDSLGLQLVDILVNQINGKLEIDTGHGTGFRITFNTL